MVFQFHLKSSQRTVFDNLISKYGNTVKLFEYKDALGQGGLKFEICMFVIYESIPTNMTTALLS